MTRLRPQLTSHAIALLLVIGAVPFVQAQGPAIDIEDYWPIDPGNHYEYRDLYFEDEDPFDWDVLNDLKSIEHPSGRVVYQASQFKTYAPGGTGGDPDDRHNDIDWWSFDPEGNLLYHGMHKGIAAGTGIIIQADQDIILSKPVVAGKRGWLPGETVTDSASGTFLTNFGPIPGDVTVSLTYNYHVDSKVTKMRQYFDVIVVDLDISAVVSGFAVSVENNTFYLARGIGLIAHNQEADVNDSKAQALISCRIKGRELNTIEVVSVAPNEGANHISSPMNPTADFGDVIPFTIHGEDAVAGPFSVTWFVDGTQKQQDFARRGGGPRWHVTPGSVVRINEVDPGRGYIELHNYATVFQHWEVISNWALCSGDDCRTLNSPDVEVVIGGQSDTMGLYAGGFMVIKVPDGFLDPNSDEVVLMGTTEQVGPATDVYDYFQYGAAGGTNEDEAVAAGVWTAGEFAPKAAEGKTYSRRDGGIGLASWGEGFPTVGGPNRLPDTVFTSTFDLDTASVRGGLRDDTLEVKAVIENNSGETEEVVWTVTVEVGEDQPPPQPVIAVQPVAPTTTDDLTVDIQQDPDPNGDPITHIITWTDEQGRTVIDGDTVPAANTLKGQTWSVEVIPRTTPPGLGDVDGPAATAQVTIGNTEPVANAMTVDTEQDTDLPIQLTGTDVDVDEGIDTLTFAIGDEPDDGTINDFDAVNGTLTYRPRAGYWGDDSFTFTVNDEGRGTSAPATVSITVNKQLAKPQLTIEDAEVIESDGQVAVTVNLTAPDGHAGISATVATLDIGSAEGGPDYTHTEEAIIWQADETGDRQFNVAIAPDDDEEGDETFEVTVIATVGIFDVVGGNGTVTIIDDDYRIEGTITYDGRQPGELVVEVYDASRTMTVEPIARIVQDLLGSNPFSFTGLRAGEYMVKAFADRGPAPNRVRDLYEAYGEYTVRATAITVPPSATGADFAIVDIDEGNGLPDWWEMDNFEQVGVDPNQDPEDDGNSHADEYAEETDPNGWRVPFNVDGTRTQLAFGIQVGATGTGRDEWDKDAVPTGPNHTITLLNDFLFSEDIRPPGADEEVWYLDAEDAGGGQDTVLTWDTSQLAPDRVLHIAEIAITREPISLLLAKRLDMQHTMSMTLPGGESKRFIIKYIRRLERTLEIRDGWNLTALGLKPDDPDISSLLSSLQRDSYIGPAYEWDGNKYVRTTVFSPLRPVWILYLSGSTRAPLQVPVPGRPLTYDEKLLPVTPGWNQAGPADPTLVPDDLQTYRWDGDSGVYRVVPTDAEFEVGRGHIFYSGEAGTILMSGYE